MITTLLLALLVGQGAAPGPLTAGDLTIEGPDAPVLLGEWFDLAISGPFDGRAKLQDTLRDPDVRIGIGTVTARGAHSILTVPVSVAREGPRSLELVLSTAGAVIDLPPIDVEVVFEMPPSHKARVAERLPPVPLPLPAPLVWPFLSSAAVFLFLLGNYAVWFGREIVVVVPPRPADLVAIEALEALRLRIPETANEIRPFVVSVSAVLRTYIEGRFEIHAPALTTEEFLDQVLRRHDAVFDRRETLEAFLTGCDLVKFARHRPDVGVLARMVDTAETFVEETRGDVEPAEVDAELPTEPPGVRPAEVAA